MRRAVGRGRQGPGLIGTAARTAVVAGTATAVSGRVAARQAQQFAAPPPHQPAPPPQQPAPPPHQPAPATVTGVPVSVDELHAQLIKLAELRSAGLLTDAEFEAQKARLLGS